MAMYKLFLVVVTVGILCACKVSAQVIVPNAGFEQADNSSQTKTLNWIAEGNDFICVTDKHSPYNGMYSLKVSAKTGGNHFFNEEFPFKTQVLRKYKISCAVKTKNLKGAVQLGARVFDAEGNTITKTAFTLTGESNQEWTRAEGIFISDETAAKLRVFGNLAGTGEVWFDEISITEIPQPVKNPSTEVMLYIHEYFDLVYENSIISDKNYIADLKRRTMYLCADSIDKDECYAILQKYTTPMLKDGHSFFTSQQEWRAMMEGGKHPVTGEVHHAMPAGKMLKDKIAYIHIPMFISSDEKLMHQYADALQNLIEGFDKQNPAGYIIDLAENGGGNSLPMIAGVGPLIGDGVCGYSFSGDGSVRTRVYDKGRTGWDTTLTFHKSNPYTLKYPNKPIAVIYSNQTGSSGEVTAIAFIGLPNAKNFGQETAGATTRVDNFEMSDGAFLNLASGIDADRNKNQYGGTIKPDVLTEDKETAMQEAVKWILGNSK